MSTSINLAIFIILLAMTAFFVATEFAIVKVRQSRIDQLLAEGEQNALAAKKVTTHLDEYLSACQLGITVTALGIGMVGEKTFEFVLHPLFELIGISTNYIQAFTLAGAFIIATFLHVVVGELAPKTMAIQKAEKITLMFAKPIILFYKLLYPFIWFLNGSARLLVGLFGMKPASEHELTHTEEELRLLLAESFKGGEINKNELKYVNNVFEFDDTIAREIMVPRTEIVGFDIEVTFEEVIERISEERYTRYPVFEGDRDNIIGFFNIKEFLTLGISGKINAHSFQMLQFVNPIIKTIETIPIQQLLTKMQKERTHMAILLDEYGGTSGLVTAEDILEELVGEIRDEFDEDEVPAIRKLGLGHYILYAKMQLEEVSELLEIPLESPDIDTLSGWYYSQNTDLDRDVVIEYEGYAFSIYEIEDIYLRYIEVRKIKEIK